MKNDPDKAPKRQREELVIHFPHYDKDEAGPASAIYLGNHKLIRFYETEQRQLFDLSTDLAEQQDLAAVHPEIVRDLDARLTDYLTAEKGGLPTANPNYDPAGERSGDRRGGMGKGEKKGGKGGKRPAPASDSDAKN